MAKKEKIIQKQESSETFKEYNIKVLKCELSSMAIQAISSLMDMLGLSADGKDKRSVYAWFMERYKPGVTFEFLPKKKEK